MRALVLLAALLACLPAWAQEQRLQDALRRMQAANQRLAADKAQLEREKLKLEQEKNAAAKARDALDAKLRSARGAEAKTSARLEKAEGEKSALQGQLQDAGAREQALQAKLAETEKALVESRAEGEALRKRVANQASTIGWWQAKTESCRFMNDTLAELGHELAERYRAKTCEDVQRDNEPFTGIWRARMEDMLEDYKDRLLGQRFDWKAPPRKEAEQ